MQVNRTIMKFFLLSSSYSSTKKLRLIFIDVNFLKLDLKYKSKMKITAR